MMRRNLVLLNLVLAGLLIACGMELRRKWVDAAQRRAEILRAPSASTAVKLSEAKRSVEAPRASNYIEVAEKMLFSRDRNPSVVVEVTEEKPLPPLPSVYGVMNLGDGYIAFLAAKGTEQRGYRTGDSVGELKLTAVDTREIEFEWEGKKIRRRVEELRAEVKQAASAQAPASVPSSQQGSAAPARSPVSTQTAAAPGVSNAGAPASSQLGPDANADTKYCVPGDATAAGTVVNGYRKVVRPSPFGSNCYWERVQ